MTVNQEFERLKQQRRYARKSVSAYSCSLLQMLWVTVRNLPEDVSKQITVEMIAEHVGKTPNYISAIFSNASSELPLRII